MTIQLDVDRVWDIEQFAREIEGINITEPPCKNCVHWNPQRKYRPGKTGQEFDGIVCCHANDMYSDYSCFDAKVAKEVHNE
jgi:hypothetical protein